MTTTQLFDEHLLQLWANQHLNTPAFVYDEHKILENLGNLSTLEQSTNCKILYSIKALSYSAILDLVRKYVSGYSASSLFECRLIREVIGDQSTIHLTSPGLNQHDVTGLNGRCDFLSFNSLSQWQQFHSQIPGITTGLRINPGLSFARDKRFDPCRPASKLGINMAELPQLDHPVWSSGVNGLHFHNNCESNDLTELVKTCKHIFQQSPELIENLEWINLGGGYLLHEREQLELFANYLNRVSSEHNIQFYYEPGKAIVGNAGYLVSSVVDIFQSDNKSIAVLDTAINHLPEVFEYQYQPDILQESASGEYSYRLAGASCLSGDLFGDYCFDKPLKIGSRIIFRNVGAYMMVKANIFNGINLPTVYALDHDGRLIMQKQYSYLDYRNRYLTG